MAVSIHERTTRIKCRGSNAYLIGTDKGFIMVDCGGPGSMPALRKALTDTGIAFSDIILIVITHSHSDHVSCAAEIAKETNASLLIHKTEAEFVQAGCTPLPKGTSGFGKFLMKMAGESERAKYEPFTPDIVIEEEYDLAVHGLEGKIIPTPGHTSGSVSLVLEDACFAGDSIFNFFFTPSLYPPFADDEQTLRETWKLFFELPCSGFYLGHGKPISKKEFDKAYQKTAER